MPANYEQRPIILTSDIDSTLQAGDWYPQHQPYANMALDALTTNIIQRKTAKGRPPFYVGTSTGRTLEAHRKELEAPEENAAFRRFVEILDTKTGSVGAEIEYRRKEDGLFVPLDSWPGELSGWNREAADIALRPRVDRGELRLQAALAQSANKLSYYVALPPRLHDDYARKIEDELYQRAQVAATVIFSAGQYLDVLPRQASGEPVNKGTAQQFVAGFLAERDNLPEDPIAIFAGDSDNDADGLGYAVESGGFGIIPANAKDAFKQKMRKMYPTTKLHIARTARFAAAIQEGLQARGVLY
jgi:hypothetical protein